MGRVWDHAKRGLHWNVGNSRKIKFWWDCWATTFYPLVGFALQPIPLDLSDLYVGSFVSTDGSWNWPKFSHLLLYNVVM